MSTGTELWVKISQPLTKELEFCQQPQKTEKGGSRAPEGRVAGGGHHGGREWGTQEQTHPTQIFPTGPCWLLQATQPRVVGSSPCRAAALVAPTYCVAA